MTASCATRKIASKSSTKIEKRRGRTSLLSLGGEDVSRGKLCVNAWGGGGSVPFRGMVIPLPKKKDVTFPRLKRDAESLNGKEGQPYEGCIWASLSTLRDREEKNRHRPQLLGKG